MSRFTVNLNDAASPQSEAQKENLANSDNASDSAINQAATTQTKKRGGCLKMLGIVGIGAAFILIVAAIGGYFYWQSVKKTPQYSLALIVDAARRDDKAEIDRLVDTDAVVDDFMPQITAKAIELYGRNLPPQTIAKVAQIVAPVLPAVKDRARAELAQVIRDKTAPVEKVPYWTIALFANRAVDIKIDGDAAFVKSKIPERPLDLKMKREDGDVWKVVGIKDEALAQKIAEKIGQEIIAIAAKGNAKKVGEQLGVKNLDDVLKNAKDIFK